MHDDHMLRTSSATTYSSCVQLVILVIAFHSVLLDLISAINWSKILSDLFIVSLVYYILATCMITVIASILQIWVSQISKRQLFE